MFIIIATDQFLKGRGWGGGYVHIHQILDNPIPYNKYLHMQIVAQTTLFVSDLVKREILVYLPLSIII